MKYKISNLLLISLKSFKIFSKKADSDFSDQDFDVKDN